MNRATIRKHLPTIPTYLEKRRKAKQNQLPKHLRPRSTWPIWLQVVLNCGLIVTLYNVIVDRDDYMTEAGPAVVLVICLLVQIYTFISAFRLRHTFAHIQGARLARVNTTLMILAFLCWAGTVVLFLS